MEQWSCHEIVKNDLPRTNNAVEGWNSNFVKLVNSKHPSFPKLIEKFQDEQKNAEILLEKRCAGQKVARLKKAKYQKLDKNLITMIKSFQHNDINGFLKGCSYNTELKSDFFVFSFHIYSILPSNKFFSKLIISLIFQN